jgi:hypothetical protein
MMIAINTRSIHDTREASSMRDGIGCMGDGGRAGAVA